ncbi:MAG TPA: hypothetical protein VJL89_06690 [Thermodesulfovibrionia bacterium]|nr:hypothetical protein [Thermodesulfovibrionia bacterium]
MIEFNIENCLRIKAERRKDLKQLPIDDKIRIVEELRERVLEIKNLRDSRIKLSVHSIVSKYE